MASVDHGANKPLLRDRDAGPTARTGSRSSVVLAAEKLGPAGRGAAFPGFTGLHPARSARLTPRRVVHLTLRAGDLVRCDGARAAFAPVAMAFGPRGDCALARLGLEADAAPLSLDAFDATPLIAWRSALGDPNSEAPRRATTIAAERGEPLVLRATEACDLWLAAPMPPEALIEGVAGGEFEIAIERAASAGPDLPTPLGPVREEFTVSRATARAYRVAKGEVIQVIDVEGRQCSDFMAFRADALSQGVERMIDGTVTRTMVRGAHPRPGLFDKFYDADMRPLLALAQDTVGRHDTFALACTARGYEDRGFPGHVNCSDNISDQMAPFGVARRAAWPAINFFFNSWIDPRDGVLRSEEGWSRAGDYVAMRALDDLICVSTACPDDIDPINGWNPTDVHVRIYQADAPIRRAVAYRAKEDDAPMLSEPSAFAPRTEALTGHVAPARNLWLPAVYAATGAIEEYWACRERATLQDMSGLRKFDVRGPDAAALLQLAMTRDITRVAVHRGVYALLCDPAGGVIDDGTLFRLAPDLFRWCCGSEESGRTLRDLAAAQGFRARVDAMHDALPNLALQGPKSREILRGLVHTKPTTPSLEALRWFGCAIARLRDETGAPFMLTRTGFTGELGYEIFCDPAHAVEIWDAVMEAGAPHGLVPMGSEALETLRVEAGLMSAGAEFGGDVNAVEAGLAFAVDFRKAEFVGHAALRRAAENPTRKLVGLRFDSDAPPAHGDPVLFGERPVGVVTSAVHSPSLGAAIAMARVAVDFAAPGIALAVGALDGRMRRHACTVVEIPFVDPERTRARG